MAKVKDLSGMRFEKLRVLYLYDVRGGDSRRVCLCECGKEKIAWGYNLKNGSTTYCNDCGKKELSVKKIDNSLQGKEFGCLKVLEFKGVDKAKNSKWLVRCNICKKERVILGLNLKKKNLVQCPCIKRKQEPKYKDISGKKYGFLKVVSISNISKKGDAYWNVVCENCGAEKKVLGASLRRGHSRSCGCMTESYVAKECKKYFKDNYGAIVEYRILINKKTGNFLPYDIFVPSGMFFIEINGEQHYSFSKRWHGTEEVFRYQKKKDSLKRKYAKENGTYIEIDIRKTTTSKEAIEKILEIMDKER